MDFTEKKLSSRSIFEGRVMHVHVDEVLTPAGTVAEREIMDHPGAVAIVAVDDQNNILLEEQYRYAFSRLLTEIPAGKLEGKEDPFLAAQRELKEETGATAETWTPMGQLIASPGCSTEIIHLYLAQGLSFGETDPDEDEFIQLSAVPYREVLRRIKAGEIIDGKSIAGVLKAAVLLGWDTKNT